MKLLIIGGTVFLGRALVEAALARGHELTLFNRGKTNPDLYPQVEHLTGDRREDLSALQGRRWDAVIDTCGYVPRVVRLSAEALSGAVDHYTFISSISVYRDTAKVGIREEDAVGTIEDETVEEITNETYGPLKALCENVVEEVYGERALNIRPGLIVGPYDPSDRFTYWPWRVAQGGDVLAPARPERLIQFIDVRDLAEWNIRLVEDRVGGVFNATGPLPQPTMGEFLQTCKEVSGSDARFIWAPDAFLVEKEVGAWMEMPLWISESDPEAAGLFTTDISKAVAAGLTFRSMAETVKATLEWLPNRPDRPWRAGTVFAREKELLAFLM